jgi:hypothetical protein
VGERYVDWTLIFVAWCLRAPPHEIYSDRVGAFWTALVQRETGRCKICEAMDAVAFLFGTLGGAETLPVPTGRSEKKSSRSNGPAAPRRGNVTLETSSTDLDELALGVSGPNPRLHLSDPDPSAHREGAPSKDLAQYLPEGSLPTGVDARGAVPTRTDRDTATQETSTSTIPSVPPDRNSLLPSGQGPATLFDPEEKFSAATEAGTDKREAPEGSAPENEDGEERFSRPPPSKLGQLCRTEGSGREKEGSGREKTDDAGDGHGPPGDDGIQDTHNPTFDQDEQDEKVSLQIPGELADRLKKAARRLGLPPAVFAARALDLVCTDVGIEPSDPEEAGSIIEHYQAQLDLLHLGPESRPDGDDS